MHNGNCKWTRRRPPMLAHLMRGSPADTRRLSGGRIMVSTTLERPDKFRIGRVFNDSFAVISRNIGLCLGLAVLFSGLPTLLYQLWLWQWAIGTETGTPEFSAQRVIVTIFVVLASMVLAAILQATLVRAAIEDLSGKRPSMGDSLKMAIPLLLPVIGIAVLVSLGAGLGFMLLIVPGIILWLRWSVAVPVLVQERRGVFGSMKRSRELTKGSRWALFGFWVILIIAVIAIQLVLSQIVMVFGVTTALILDALVRSVVSVVTSVAPAVSYVELRQVKEGTSVDELAEIFS
ncbi:glycerophosphoryl diester phosphodiesterase membrane domain-containing protein [Mesorhizobium delmotii]|nr:glycerophosphoryl diester phosphodiesterase membrane domain-containing protein [Mesorhizobium delmotii]